MLTIRTDQMAVFASVAAEQALDRAVSALQAGNDGSGQAATIQELRTLAADGLRRAPAFGIAGEADLRRWLLLLLRHGRDLDQLPTPGYLLRRPAMTGEAKLDALEAWDRALRDQAAAGSTTEALP